MQHSTHDLTCIHYGDRLQRGSSLVLYLGSCMAECLKSPSYASTDVAYRSFTVTPLAALYLPLTQLTRRDGD